MANAVLTGDLADNMQRNETEWVVKLIEGGTLDPNSGTADLSGSSCPPGTPLDDPKAYTGVQDYDDYSGSPAFYDPDVPGGQYAGWPAYPGLMDRAQRPFEAEGLKVPSYSVFGNHDGLVQGNEDGVRSFEDIATGCVKPYSPATTDLASGLDPTFLTTIAGTSFMVPPDENRQFVDKAQFMALHATGKQGDAHGFAYVSEGGGGGLTRRRGVLLVEPAATHPLHRARHALGGRHGPVLGRREHRRPPVAVAREGAGRRNRAQRADRPVRPPRDRLAHVHDLDEEASQCTERDEHGHDTNPGCDRDPRSSQPLHLGDELKELLLAHPHVVAFVAGHSHNSRVAGTRPRAGPASGRSRRPAIADWPRSSGWSS